MEISTGKKTMPPRILLYGGHGLGKSTFPVGYRGAIGAPKPLYIDIEGGLNEIDCVKTQERIKELDDFLDALKFVLTKEHDYGTLVIDSMDWLEKLIWKQVCMENNPPVDKIDEIGYFRGFGMAADIWHKILESLTEIRDKRGMVIIGIAHAGFEKVEDPTGPDYDMIAPKLHKKSSPLVQEWADAVLCLRKNIRTKTENAGFNQKKIKPVNEEGKLILHTEGRPAFQAKNRYELPPEIDFSWESFTSNIGKKR